MRVPSRIAQSLKNRLAEPASAPSAATPHPHKRQKRRNFDGGFADRDGQYWSLNPVGTRVWTTLAEFGDVASMYTVLAREFDVDPDLLQRDIDALIAELQAARLIVGSG